MFDIRLFFSSQTPCLISHVLTSLILYSFPYSSSSFFLRCSVSLFLVTAFFCVVSWLEKDWATGQRQSIITQKGQDTYTDKKRPNADTHTHTHTVCIKKNPWLSQCSIDSTALNCLSVIFIFLAMDTHTHTHTYTWSKVIKGIKKIIAHVYWIFDHFFCVCVAF